MRAHELLQQLPPNARFRPTGDADECVLVLDLVPKRQAAALSRSLDRSLFSDVKLAAPVQVADVRLTVCGTCGKLRRGSAGLHGRLVDGRHCGSA